MIDFALATGWLEWRMSTSVLLTCTLSMINVAHGNDIAAPNDYLQTSIIKTCEQNTLVAHHARFNPQLSSESSICMGPKVYKAATT